MMDRSAFQACFTDWRLIKGRKCVQVVLELPIEAADQAYQALGGMPDPGKSVWCAVARMSMEAKEVVQHTGSSVPNHEHKTLPVPVASKPARARTPVAHDKRLTVQSVLTCKEPAFHRWLAESNSAWRIMTEGTPEERAAALVRAICRVKHRSEIAPGSDAAERWDALYSKYIAWREAPEMAAP